MIRKIKGASFRLDRHSHPGARVLLDHLEHSLWFADSAAGLDEVEQSAQRHVGIRIEPARSSLVLDPHEHVTRQQPACNLRQFRRIVFRKPLKHLFAMLFLNRREV